MPMTTLLNLILIIGAYLLGSLCSAVIISRVFSLPDPREKGSKNAGATNVLRLSGKKYAFYTLLGDFLKGLIPVLIAKFLGVSPGALGFIAFATVLGHIYPLYFEFNGGKGVATAIGALFGLNIILGILVALIWVLVANFSRYSSLASISALSAMPFLGMMTIHSVNVFPPLMFITVIVLYKHRANISRLINGEETPISFKKSHIELNDVINEMSNIDKKPDDTKS